MKMKTHKIAFDSIIHFGQPCIAVSRNPVYCILELLKADIPFEEIIAKYYPDITVEEIKACVQYALDVVRSEEVHLAWVAAS